MKKNIIIISLAALSLTGCGVLKNYDREKVAHPIDTANLYGDALSGESLGLGDLKWRELFTDPTLQTLIERVLEQNTNIKNADLTIQQVNYAVKAAKWAFAPSISLTANGSVSKMWDPYERAAYSDIPNSKSYNIGMTIGWQQVNLLQLRNAKKGAEMSREQARAAKQAVQASLVSTTATMYYTLAQLDEQLTLMEQTKANWGEYLRMQKLLMTEAGQANIAAVASVEATYWSICQSIVTIKDNIHILENQLSTLLNEPSAKISRASLNSFRAPSIIATGAPISLLSRRPDVRVAEMTLASAFYDVNQAKAAFYPSLTLSATGTFTNGTQANINPGAFIGQAIAGLAQPIFQNGKLVANLKINKAQMEIAANNFTNAVISAGNEVNTAMLKVRSAEELREMIDKQVKAQDTAYNATHRIFDGTSGTSGNYLNVITAHNNLIQAQMTQIGNRMEAISATVELYLALGGGAE
ncbi:MAG: TolC family protein [Bacteroidaceae bacterium]|nr:TolC family protein [Bacteroidaceae bacterium]